MCSFHRQIALAILMALLLTNSPVVAQAELAEPRECLGISVNTEDTSQLDAAVAVCTRALRRNDLSAVTRADLFIHRGVAYRNKGQLVQSLADLSAAKSLTPNDAHAARMLAWTYREMSRLDEAEEEYNRAISLEPHSQAFLSRCFVRFDMRRFEDALVDCEKAHGIKPSEDSTYMTAVLRFVLGRPSALPLLESAIGSAIVSGRIYGLLADIHEAEGRTEQALRVRQQGRRKFPEDPRLALPPKR